MAISKIEMLDELKSQYLYKATFFSRLAACMELSRALMDDSEMLGDERFPPSDKIINFHSDNNMFPDQPSIDDHDYNVPPKPSETDDSIANGSLKFFDEIVTSEMEYIISKFKDTHVDQDTSISFEDAATMIKYILNNLQDIQVDQDISFEILADYCTLMRDLCLMTPIDYTIKCCKLINNIDSLSLHVAAKAYQLLGYSTAQMEESRRNKIGGAAKITICMNDMKELARLILPPDQRGDNLNMDIVIDKARFDALCKKVRGITQDVSYATKEKYRKGASKIIGREITYEGKK